MSAYFESARLHVETGGSIEAALGMTDLDIINTLASNRQIIDETRRQRDDAEATLERVKAEVERPGFFTTSILRDRIRAALKGSR